MHPEPTWTVAGHHYALVLVTGLEPDTSAPYEVLVDDDVVWPEPGDSRPGCRIRTVSPGGRCRSRSARAATPGPRPSTATTTTTPTRSPACAERMVLPARRAGGRDFLLMLGDQVYADETTPETRRRIAARRDLDAPPGAEVADFEEYTLAVPRELDRSRGAVAAGDPAVVDDLRRPRRPRRLEHLAVVAARDGAHAVVARAHRRRAVVVLGVPAHRQPVAGRPGRGRAVPAGALLRARRRGPAARARRRRPTPRPTAARAHGGRTAGSSGAPGC